MFVLIPMKILRVLGFSGVCTVQALCFLRRNSTFEYFAYIIVNILLVLIPTLVIPFCIVYILGDKSSASSDMSRISSARFWDTIFLLSKV